MITNIGVRVKEARVCFLCGREGELLYQNLQDRLFGAPGTWSLMLCSKCGLVWLNPQPVMEDIGKLYETYFTHNMEERLPKLAHLRRLLRNSILATYMGYGELADNSTLKIAGRIFSMVGPVNEIVELGVMGLHGHDRGKLLDVGCGSGRFLAEMRKLGWEVTGVEPDGVAVEVAKGHFGLSVYKGTLEEARFSNNTFDAITMNHVIEHLSDPIGTLKECRRVLKPGGKLVIVTPNIASLGHRFFKKAWRGLEPPRHLFLFSPCTLQAVAEQAGLRVLKLRTTARSARGMWAASRLIQRKGALPGGLVEKQNLLLRLSGLAFWMVEYRLCRLKDVGEELVLVATKSRCM